MILHKSKEEHENRWEKHASGACGQTAAVPSLMGADGLQIRGEAPGDGMAAWHTCWHVTGGWHGDGVTGGMRKKWEQGDPGEPLSMRTFRISADEKALRGHAGGGY